VNAFDFASALNVPASPLPGIEEAPRFARGLSVIDQE
jgi:hypothetical protein